jgi:hypothetical protein
MGRFICRRIKSPFNSPAFKALLFHYPQNEYNKKGGNIPPEEEKY